MPKVIHIFICSQKGEPMREAQSVRALAGLGLEGDRYALGKGTYSGLPNKSDRTRSVRQVSIISSRAFDEANSKLPIPFTLAETRRNIVIDGDIELLSLIGKRFIIGVVEMQGFEDCAPCKLPGELARKPGFKEAFLKCGGLRAEILSDGSISVGDEMYFF